MRRQARILSPGIMALLVQTGIGVPARAGDCPQNLVPNPGFAGTGGQAQGVTGQVPDDWRGFAVGAAAADIAILPLPQGELYPFSPATNAVKLNVTAFGTDQGFDHPATPFPIIAGQSYHFECYVKTANADDGNQKFHVGFPLFDAGGYLGRAPGAKSNLTATASWTKFVGPTFSDTDAIEAHVAFRCENDGGQNAILIALPTVPDPTTSLFELPTPDEIAQRQSWPLDDKLIGTTYFYWYRWPDLHFFDDPAHTDDALTDHFLDPEAVSMERKAWHKTELSDMIDAGIDMLWPVYWAAPGNFGIPPWDLYVTGLCPLQEAIAELQDEGRDPPKIGMFYDTTSLLNSVRFASPPDGKADLTTPQGREIFYQTIRSFFTAVLPKHWACLDGRPIVVLYAAAFAENYNQAAFDYVYTQFAAEFDGVVPFLIRENSWNAQTDSYYRWGAALNGPFFDGIAAIGPGYDDTAVPGRTTPVRKRQDGRFYRSAWLELFAKPQTILHLETWSEFHEGTEIAQSAEYGRKYIDMTALYGWAWKLGLPRNQVCLLECGDADPPPPDMLDGQQYADAMQVEITAAGGQIIADGIDSIDTAEGTLALVSHADDTYLRTDLDRRNRYAAFSLKDPFYYDQQRRAQVTLEYLDQGRGDVILQYDSWDKMELCCGSYTHAPKISLTNTGALLTRTLLLENPRFANRQTGDADLRFYVEQGPLFIKRVKVDVLNLQEPSLRVEDALPAPGPAPLPDATLSTPPAAIVVVFDSFPVPESVNASTFRLERSGGDGRFDDGNDVPIEAGAIEVSGSAAVLDLTGVSLPVDTYRITLVGRGQDPIRNHIGRPLDGKFSGIFPSGDGTGAGDFVCTFILDPVTGDLDGDGDVDTNDFLTFSNCFNGALLPPRPACQNPAADFDSDADVDGNDFLTFSNCFNGSTNPPACP